jgi:ActR/RegA family two-component response regulator
MNHILIHHPNEITLRHLIRMIDAAGYRTSGTTEEDQALQLMRELDPDVFLVLPVRAGDLTPVAEVHTKYPSICPVVLAPNAGIVMCAEAIGAHVIIRYAAADNPVEAIGRAIVACRRHEQYRVRRWRVQRQA